MTASPDRPPLPRVVIVGGGSAGWMAAAGLTALLAPASPDITLVESDAIGIVGVGEATLPQLRAFNQRIGLDEADLLREAKASFKLGIRFLDWGVEGSDYIHPFGGFGRPAHGYDFLQHWLVARQQGDTPPLEAFSYAIEVMRRHLFARPDPDRGALGATIDYAYHFDASLYAGLLRRHAEGRGVKRIEGRITGVDAETAGKRVHALLLEDGRRIEGDLFIDCSGFRALLIDSAMGADWEDWSHWLPCDRAWAVPTERTSDFHPYTKVTARQAGWQWRIPLQHRVGNGHVFSSRYMGEDEARALLLDNLDGDALAEPRMLRFTAGRRARAWTGNVVAIGLSSGFLEPLESTSIYLIQRGVECLAQLFPWTSEPGPLAAEFNARMDEEYERIRDFLILHYHLNRKDGALWRDCAAMEVPESLQRKLALFATSGRVESFRSGLFSPPSWASVMLGQGLVPAAPQPLLDATAHPGLAGELATLRREVAALAGSAVPHAEAIAATIGMDAAA